MQVDLRKLRDAALIVLALRLYYTAVLFLAQYLADAPHQPPRRPGPPDGVLDWLHWIFVNPWVHRDAVYYGRIVGDGYSVEAGTTAFHPLFPFTSWLASLPFGEPTVGMWIISTAAAIALTVAMARYVAEVHEERWATGASAALLVMPVGLVWLLFYTEALFVAFAVGCLLYLHRGKWWAAAAFGALATLTRQQGLVLLLPMLWVIWRRDRSIRALASVMLIPAAYGCFAAYRVCWLQDVDLAAIGSLTDLTQAFLVSSAAQEIAPGQRIAFPWEPFIGQITAIWQGGETHLILDLVLGLGVVGFVLSRWKLMTGAEQAYCVGATVVALCYYNGELAPYMALPRHVIILFPVGYLFARYVESKNSRLFVGAGLVFNTLLLLLYGTLRWIP